jgi:tetratricopeptide (TPR) repeat protein
MAIDNIEQHEQQRVQGLQQRFHQALEARARNDVDGAAELLRSIFQIELWLAEPRMELVHILLNTKQLTEAEEHAREALRILETGGQWTDDLSADALMSLAYTTLGETLRQRADSDEVIFGDPEKFKQLHSESRTAFLKASALDPDNQHAIYWGFDPRRYRSEEE